MTANPDTIWEAPAYLPYLQPRLTDEAIRSAEKKIGYKLPEEYLGLLRVQNGGYIRFSLPEMVHHTIAGIGPHFPSLIENNFQEGQDCVSFSLKGLIPFDGDGHWHLCLDYRENASSPSISYVDIECDRQSTITGSFAEYLRMLQLDVEDEIVVSGVDDIETVKSYLSSALSINFYPPDTSSHGYPTQRARLGTEADPQWVFISPNVVPRGFVRQNDRRYAELKDLMPGSVPRFPELPKNSYILSADSGVRARVGEAFARSQFVVRPLRDYLK